MKPMSKDSQVYILKETETDPAAFPASNVYVVIAVTSVGAPVMVHVVGDKVRPAGRMVAEVNEQEVMAVPPLHDMTIGATICPTFKLRLPNILQPLGALGPEENIQVEYV